MATLSYKLGKRIEWDHENRIITNEKYALNVQKI